jgi:hypothetical protein
MAIKMSQVAIAQILKPYLKDELKLPTDATPKVEDPQGSNEDHANPAAP